MKLQRVASLSCALVAALALGSCSNSDKRDRATTTTSSRATREVLVTIGSSATFGDGLDHPLLDAWPQKLYHDAFPQSTVLVNASNRGVTAASSLGQPLSIALETHATVVAVWLGDIDLAIGVTPATFEADLDRLVARLRDSGARVLVGNLVRSSEGAVAYDNAIARVARARGATLVDLATAVSNDPEVGPTAEAKPASSRAIAAAFAAALPGS